MANISRSNWTPATTSVVYRTFWYFAAERQNMFLRRLEGCDRLSTDSILLSHRFTNSYRVLDRVTQYLIKNVIGNARQEEENLFFRIMIFKIFNRIDTWELLEESLGEIDIRDFEYRKFDAILSRAMQDGKRIFSAAYIMPSGSSSFGSPRKHRNYLKLLQLMIKEAITHKLDRCKNLGDVFSVLRSYPTLGDFLAYQYATDLNYSELVNFPENQFVMPGPGALDGIRKCFPNPGGLTEVNIIQRMYDIQDKEFQRFGLQFEKIGGTRELQYIDIQNIFCEVSKYARLAHPEVRGVSDRKRIKQKYQPNTAPMDVVYPAKWKIKRTFQNIASYPVIAAHL